MENKKVLIGNFKSYMTFGDIKNYLRIIDNKIKHKNVILCPSNIYIPYFIDNGFNVGIQNICYNDNCTGEITPVQAKSMGVKYSIIGHSERRIQFNEDDLIVNKKVIKSLNNELKVILCIGETEEEKELLKTNAVIKRQLKNDLRGVTDSSNLIIAYEPVWAIGTNKIPSNKDIRAIVSYIKNLSKELYNLDVKVVYGGSVNKNNIKLLNEIDNLDGFLIGKASTEANEFLELVEVVVPQ